LLIAIIFLVLVLNVLPLVIGIQANDIGSLLEQFLEYEQGMYIFLQEFFYNTTLATKGTYVLQSEKRP